MPCYHPLIAYDLSPKYSTHLDKKIISFNASPQTALKATREGRVLQLPCGQCIGCRIQYSREWADRCMLELSYHDSAYFATLTYDDAHLPVSYSVDKASGEAFPVATLVPRDLQLFMKRLRFHFNNDNIRFFACGEYGSTTFRPHYHLILFGLHLNDLVPYKKSRLGDDYFDSESFQSCWCDSNGDRLGMTVLSTVNWNTCAYVARYVVKKNKGPNSKDDYENLGIVPQFSRMSLKPGIGRLYYDENKEKIWKYDKINISTPDGGLSFAPPRFFKKILQVEDPVLANELSEIRKFRAIERSKGKKQLTDNDLYDILRIEEEKKQKVLKSLIRIL